MVSQNVYIPDLGSFAAVPEAGILSRTVVDTESARVVYFAFAEGELLSEHTAAMPAILHILDGEAHLTLGNESYDAGAGAWAYMPANLPHSIQARTPLIMLLTLLKKGS
ncbi:MAG: cupin domain-containing protein [Anaerolineae bacterium]